MAYFLKKTNNKKGLYLQIYESFYEPNRGHAAHRSFKPLGYVHELIEKGIEDPIAYYQHEVDQLNVDFNLLKQEKKSKQIGDESPEKYLGYFPLKNIQEALGVKNHLDLLQTHYDFEFNIYDVLSSLIYARMINPRSKHKTYYDVVPKLFDSYDYSLSQLYRAMQFFGDEHEKIIQIYNHFVEKKYSFDCSISYFDCTNFYFEIDQEDALRRKGPSKENRKEPIVGMGLLLDTNQIPMGMKIFPGNQSEQPVIREVIQSLKMSQSIQGKTVRVADKGLNSAQNIVDALGEGDGYIFSKSVKTLPAIEKTWVLLDHDYKDVLNSNGKVVYKIKECIDKFPYTITLKNGKKKTIQLKEKRIVTYNPKLAKKQKMEIHKQIEKAKKLKASQAKRNEYGDSAKYVNFESTDKQGNLTDGKIKVSLNEKSINESLSLVGYNLIVTSETAFSADYIYSTYRNLWRIEESFRIMKSYLDARPVYLQKESSIIGHFLICYLSVLLMRLLQLKVLDNKYSSEEIIKFIRDFKVVQVSNNKYINLTKTSSFIKEFSEEYRLPITSYYLSNTKIKKVLNNRFSTI